MRRFLEFLETRRLFTQAESGYRHSPPEDYPTATKLLKRRVQVPEKLGCLELVPALHDKLVFVHGRVPYCDSTHAVLERATVANVAGLLHYIAKRVGDLTLCWFTLEPVAPLPRLEIFLCV